MYNFKPWLIVFEYSRNLSAGKPANHAKFNTGNSRLLIYVIILITNRYVIWIIACTRNIITFYECFSSQCDECDFKHERSCLKLKFLCPSTVSSRRSYLRQANKNWKGKRGPCTDKRKRGVAVCVWVIRLQIVDDAFSFATRYNLK